MKRKSIRNNRKSPSRRSINAGNSKRRHAKGYFTKVTGLVYVLHKHTSIRAEICLGILCRKGDRLGEMDDLPGIGLPVIKSSMRGTTMCSSWLLTRQDRGIHWLTECHCLYTKVLQGWQTIFKSNLAMRKCIGTRQKKMRSQSLCIH